MHTLPFYLTSIITIFYAIVFNILSCEMHALFILTTSDVLFSIAHVHSLGFYRVTCLVSAVCAAKIPPSVEIFISYIFRLNCMWSF